MREGLIMARTEKVELTALCLVYSEEAYLLQNRVKEDWKGYTYPVDILKSESRLLMA